MLRHALACTGLLALCGLLWLRPSLRTHAPLHREYSIDHGYVISLNPRLDLHTPLYLGFESTLVPAINSSVAVQQGVPLYVRHTMAHGRHDHLQISNGAMLGCYLSHVRVWEMFLNTSQEVVAVFQQGKQALPWLTRMLIFVSAFLRQFGWLLVLAVFAGFFLYISASDLIPESHHRHPRLFTTLATFAGAALIFVAVHVAG